MPGLEQDDLENLGIPKTRAQQFLGDIEKEKERKRSLDLKLKEIDCEYLFETLARAGCTSEQVESLNNSFLKELGVSFSEMKTFFKKVHDAKEAKIKGTFFKCYHQKIERNNIIRTYTTFLVNQQ